MLEKGFRVFGSVRNEGDARRLQSTFGVRFTPLVFDVRDQKSIDLASMHVKNELQGQVLIGLVNNAGVGLTGPLLHQPIEEIRAVMDTNLLGPVLVTRAFAPLLGADPTLEGPKGRIVNISSIAGKIAQPFAAAYVASKHALEGLSDVMRRELHLYGIGVSVVAPATVKTPIWNSAEGAIGCYSETAYGEPFDKGVRSLVDGARAHGLEAVDVAKTVYRALTSRHPRLRYAPAKHAILEQLIPQLVPDKVVDIVVSKSLGLNPEDAEERQK
jgi:NAD(P)-dependent dehydrogenase (short-subunit alcohol dehydrogenase family)